MNKKLEYIGKLFINKYLNDWGLYIDIKDKIIDVADNISVRELYRAIQDIFDEPCMMDMPHPVRANYFFSHLDLKNGWTINFNGKEYKNGDTI